MAKSGALHTRVDPWVFADEVDDRRGQLGVHRAERGMPECLELYVLGCLAFLSRTRFDRNEAIVGISPGLTLGSASA